MLIKMRLAEYLFRRIRESGAETVFGLPGDFALPLFRVMDELGTRVITLAHEPSLGYAADAYARLKGFSAAVVTYGAGGLNIINAVAQGYAEKSPILIVSGAPEILSRRKNLLVHHRVKTFESQKRIYDEICCASVILERVEDAAVEIDYVIAKIRAHKRPGYIEIPRDLCNCEIPVADVTASDKAEDKCFPESVPMAKSLDRLIARLNNATRPLLYLGVEVRRLGLQEAVRLLVDRLNIPFTTSMEGKAVIPESHANFIGTYMGRAGSPTALKAMLESDLIINLGTMMSDVNLGLFSGDLDPAKTVHLTTEGLVMTDFACPSIPLTTALEHILKNPALKRFSVPQEWRWQPLQHPELGPITTDGVIAVLNRFIAQRKAAIVVDVGEELFACGDLQADTLIAPTYYASMGFAVPAALAVAEVLKDHAVVALVGDGAFQMTGQELGSAGRYGLCPIVVVMNNGGYATMRAFDADREVYTIPAWDYVQFASAIGVAGSRVSTLEEFSLALDRHTKARRPALIEAVMQPGSLCDNLRRMIEIGKPGLESTCPQGSSKPTGHELTDGIVYGPVESRRLGKTLGINLSPRGAKYCNFNCLYCQLGCNDPAYIPSPDDFPTVTSVTEALRRAHRDGLWGQRDGVAVTLVISGNGEPSLNPRFAETAHAIATLKDELSPATRLVAFTNGSQLADPSVIKAMNALDECHIKFDPDPLTVDAPAPDFDQQTLVHHALRLKNPVLQACLIRLNNRPPDARALNVWAKRSALIKPKRVDLYTISRLPARARVMPATTDDFELATRLLKEQGVAHIAIAHALKGPMPSNGNTIEFSAKYNT